MSKTFKQQPTKTKEQREAMRRYKQEKQKIVLGEAQKSSREWKSALEWRLGKDD